MIETIRYGFRDRLLYFLNVGKVAEDTPRNDLVKFTILK